MNSFYFYILSYFFIGDRPNLSWCSGEHGLLKYYNNKRGICLKYYSIMEDGGTDWLSQARLNKWHLIATSIRV